MNETNNVRDMIEKAKDDVHKKHSVNSALNVFIEGSKEYQRLAAAAATIQSFTGKQCKIDMTYFDYGQNWTYTTILAESGLQVSKLYQVLNPKQQLNIVYGSPDAWYESKKRSLTQ